MASDLYILGIGLVLGATIHWVFVEVLMFQVKGDRPAARIQAAFEAEQRKRPERTLEEWRGFELLRAHELVTQERARLGKGPVPMALIERAEACARGHIDYTLKLALYCEMIVLDQEPSLRETASRT